MPATDSPATLEPCLRAIEAASDPLDELIVVEHPASLGAAKARNAGARQATGDILVFVDADVVVRPDALERIRAALHHCPARIAIFGSYDDSPVAPGLVSGFRNLLHHHVHQSSPGRAETFWSGLGAVRRGAFHAVGGFDAERFGRASVEDVDLGMRLAAAGGRIELDPELQGSHLKAWTLLGMVRTDFARRGVPWVGLQLRARSSSTALNLGWRHRLSALSCLGGAGGALLGPSLGLAPALAVAAGLLALLALAALNHRFYALLARRQGRLAVAGGVGLHAIHHVTAAAALVAGLLVFGPEQVLDRGRRSSRLAPEGGREPQRRLPRLRLRADAEGPAKQAAGP